LFASDAAAGCGIVDCARAGGAAIATRLADNSATDNGATDNGATENGSAAGLECPSAIGFAIEVMMPEYADTGGA